jgi:hypothetical protein
MLETSQIKKQCGELGINPSLIAHIDCGLGFD